MPGDGKTAGVQMSRKLAFTMLLCMLSLKSFGQAPDPKLVSRFRPGILWFFSGFRPSKMVDARKYDRLVVDLVYNDWTGKTQKPFQQHWSSIGWNVQTFFDIPLTARNTVALGIGLGYGHTRMRIDQTLERIESSRTTMLSDFQSFSPVDKSVFRSNKIFIPVELRFRTPGWKHFKFHIGGRIGYQFKASTSVFSSWNGHKTENRVRGFYDLNPLLLSLHARIGIRNWALTASYNVTPYFKNKASTQLNGLEIGLSVSFF
jgi:hypothetical protein